MKKTLSALAMVVLIFAAQSTALSVSKKTDRQHYIANSLGKSLANRFTKKKAERKPGRVKVFLVAVGDNGKTGKRIGCEDSLVAVTRSVKSIAAPLKSALEELLTIPRDYDGKLSNFWGGNNLKIKSVSLRRGLATIRLTGDGPEIAGVCDGPRITSQIEATAKQFPTVKRVQIFVNNQRLEQVVK